MDLWLPALWLFLSLFFSGIEIAFISVNKLHLELSEKQGMLSGKIMSYFVHRPALLFGTTRIGKSAFLVLFSIAITQFFVPIPADQLFTGFNFKTVVTIIGVILSAVVILTTTESITKSWFTINPGRVLHVLAIPFG